MREDERIILDNFEGDGESVSVSLKALMAPIEDIDETKSTIISGKIRRIFYQKSEKIEKVTGIIRNKNIF